MREEHGKHTLAHRDREDEHHSHNGNNKSTILKQLDIREEQLEALNKVVTHHSGVGDTATKGVAEHDALNDVAHGLAVESSSHITIIVLIGHAADTGEEDEGVDAEGTHQEDEDITGNQRELRNEAKRLDNLLC